MEEKKINKRIVFSVVAVLLLIAVVAGATYAYFSAGGSSAQQTVTSGTLKVSFTSMETITAGDLTPITKSEVNSKATQINFTVKNEGNISSLFDIDFTDVVIDPELKDKYFKWQLLEGDTIINEGNFLGTTTTLSLKENIKIDAGASKSYKVFVYILESNTNQNAMQGKNFSAKVTVSSVLTNDGWNSTKQMNKPELVDGMIPVKWNETYASWIVCQETDPEWYDYSNQKWANVMLSDGKYKADTVEIGKFLAPHETGSMFVWIPRYEYKIDSAAQTIDVKFIPVTQDTVDSGYTYIHPAFTNNVENGGWDSELSGIWFAKYQAGYQAGTIGTDVANPINASETVVYSNYNYSSSAQDNSAGGVSTYITNALGQDLSLDDYVNEKISYPVFKPSTYAYNLANISDMYLVARDMEEATEFYGFTNVDTHMTKNSEWGAATYLAHSSYGRNGAQNISRNSLNLNPNKDIEALKAKEVYAVTGYTGNEFARSDMVAGASTTNNMTGIFDMSGATNERVAGYVANGHEHLTTFGFAFTTNEDGTLKTTDTKYVTTYPYDSTDEMVNNYSNYKNNYSGIRYGEAIIETTLTGNDGDGDGNIGWYSQRVTFPKVQEPFFVRGGRMDQTGRGIFTYAFNNGDAATSKTGFRVVIVAE